MLLTTDTEVRRLLQYRVCCVGGLLVGRRVGLRVGRGLRQCEV